MYYSNFSQPMQQIEISEQLKAPADLSPTEKSLGTNHAGN